MFPGLRIEREDAGAEADAEALHQLVRREGTWKKSTLSLRSFGPLAPALAAIGNRELTLGRLRRCIGLRVPDSILQGVVALLLVCALGLLR